jgi:hypothetical protein
MSAGVAGGAPEKHASVDHGRIQARVRFFEHRGERDHRLLGRLPLFPDGGNHTAAHDEVVIRDGPHECRHGHPRTPAHALQREGCDSTHGDLVMRQLFGEDRCRDLAVLDQGAEDVASHGRTLVRSQFEQCLGHVGKIRSTQAKNECGLALHAGIAVAERQDQRLELVPSDPVECIDIFVEQFLAAQPPNQGGQFGGGTPDRPDGAIDASAKPRFGQDQLVEPRHRNARGRPNARQGIDGGGGDRG